MAVFLGPLGDARPQFFTDQGAVLNGGLLYAYAAGSTTPQNTYTDSTGGSANAHPIVLDADGRAPNGIWLSEGLSYKFVLKDSDGVTLWTEDNVDGINDASTTQDEWIASALTPTYISANSFSFAGDQTGVFHVGRRLKIVDAGGTKYTTIRAAVFTTITTFTLDLDAGGSLSSPLTSVSYGVLSATNRSIPSGFITPGQITANQNDYAPTGYGSADTLRLSSDARRNITGLAGGTDGREVTIHNVGTFPIHFKYEDSNSTAANRFAFGHTLSGGHSLKLKYDGTSARWRCTFKQDPSGTEKNFLGTTVPEGQLALDGSNVSRTTYAALFNEIGTTWGVGDGSTTFGLADSRRRVAVGTGGTGTATLDDTVGSTGGEETHALTIAETAAHTHTTDSQGAHVHNVQAGNNDTGGGVTELSSNADGVTGGEVTVNNVALSSGAHTHTAQSTGSGTAHNVMQPSYVVTKTVVF